MNNLWTLLKATKSNINIIKKGTTNNLKTVGKIILAAFIVFTIIVTVVSYAFLVAEPLSKVNMTFVEISLFIIVDVLISFMGAVYKSQGVLFKSKDNDMLLSLPISKRTILASRIITLIVYQYIWTAIIMLPVFGVYAFFEHPGLSYYILSLIMLIILPIIPTILGAIFGYILSALSSFFKKQNVLQIVFNMIFILAIFIVSFSLQTFIQNIAAKAKGINDLLNSIYLPLGVYIESILKLNTLKFGLMILANIALIVVFVYIFSLNYFKLISKLSEHHANGKYVASETKTKSPLKALISKEMKRFFSSSIYVINTGFGAVLILLGSGYLVYLKITGQFDSLGIGQYGKYLVLGIVASLGFIEGTMATTASSISIEGKNIWLTKMLPVETSQIFLAKILMNCIIMLPSLVISVIVTGIVIKISIGYIVALVLITILMMISLSILGIAVNLALPKLDAPNDTVIVYTTKNIYSVSSSIFTNSSICFVETSK